MRPWNKGKKETRPEVIERLRKSHKGQEAWNKGLTQDDPRVRSYVEKRITRVVKTCKSCGETIEVKLCLQFRKKYCSWDCRNKGLKGRKVWNKGKSHNPKEKHWNWQGGIGRLPYPFSFNEELRKLIRKRDGYKCQWCRISQNKCKRKLDVHHIDKNKNNLNPNNLISLCRSCHITIHNSGGEYEKNANSAFGIITFANGSLSSSAYNFH